MVWKKATVTFDDGTNYEAEVLLSKSGDVYNLKLNKDGKIIKEIEVDKFANKLQKSVEDVYPYKVKLKD